MLGNETGLKISKIPLSDDTLCRRIPEMSSDIEKNVSGNKLQCSDFALQVDESTNITNKKQLIASDGYSKSGARGKDFQNLMFSKKI